jgi:hypothetical protein
MTPILGIVASQLTGRLTSYESIATTTVGAGGASTITFSSIPAGYQHLQIRYIGRTASSGNANINLNVNGDTTTSSVWHVLYGTGSGSVAPYAFDSAYIIAGQTTTSGVTANAFGIGVIDILDYKDTSKNKTVRSLSGSDTNGAGIVYFSSGQWRNTNAITSLAFTTGDATNFAQYTQFALYGIKG